MGGGFRIGQAFRKRGGAVAQIIGGGRAQHLAGRLIGLGDGTIGGPFGGRTAFLSQREGDTGGAQGLGGIAHFLVGILHLGLQPFDFPCAPFERALAVGAGRHLARKLVFQTVQPRFVAREAQLHFLGMGRLGLEIAAQGFALIAQRGNPAFQMLDLGFARGQTDLEIVDLGGMLSELDAELLDLVGFSGVVALDAVERCLHPFQALFELSNGGAHVGRFDVHVGKLRMQVGILAAEAPRLLQTLLVGQHQRHALVALAFQGLLRARVFSGIGRAGSVFLCAHLLRAERHGGLQSIFGKAHDAAVDRRSDQQDDDDRRQKSQGKEKRELDHELAVSNLYRNRSARRASRSGRRCVFRFLALNMTFRALQVSGAGFCPRDPTTAPRVY